MLNIIASPTTIKAAGSPPKLIEEFFGRVASGTEQVSIARMTSPSGWQEPGQTPDFDEFTVVVRGKLRVETVSEVQDISAGQAIYAPRGQWVRYSTPCVDGAEYFSVCLPAFSPKTVHRDEG